MKKVFVAVVPILLIMLSACNVNIAGLELTTRSDEETVSGAASSIQDENISSDIYDSTEESTDGDGENEVTSEEPEMTVPESEMTSSDNVTEKVTVPQSTEKEEDKKTTLSQKETEVTSSASLTEVDLSISMPVKNGTMLTDSSADNKFIMIVNKKRNIEPDLLAAVFSVPESGQNYVFEFYDEDGRTVDDIRRVYLIDSDGDIVSVSAVLSSEKENISSVENWFSMNVLIKEIIYPAVKDEIK